MNLIESKICPLCGGQGHLKYDGQKDRLFGAEGIWSFWVCTSTTCGILWLNPRPDNDDLHLAYDKYYTHGESEIGLPASFIRPPIISSKKKKNAIKRLSKGVFRLVRDPVRLVLNFPWRVAKIAPKLHYPTAIRHGDAGKILRFMAGLWPATKAETDFAVFYLPVKGHGRLLDVGCGDGSSVERMNAQGWSAEGVEVDPKAVRQGRDRGLIIYQGTLEGLDSRSNAYDAVVACHVIEHVPDPLAFLRSAFERVDFGGTLVVITPNKEALGHRLFGNAWLHLDPPRHLHIHTAHSLRMLANEVSGDHAEIFTTVRDISNSYAASWDIRRHGRYAWGTQRPLIHRWFFRALATAVGWASLVVPSLGEELVLKMHRPAHRAPEEDMKG